MDAWRVRNAEHPTMHRYGTACATETRGNCLILRSTEKFFFLKRPSPGNHPVVSETKLMAVGMDGTDGASQSFGHLAIRGSAEQFFFRPGPLLNVLRAQGRN